MGRLAQATRIAKTRLRGVTQEAKATRGRVQAEELASSRAYLMKAVRRLPKPAELEDLLEDIKAHWETEEGEGGGAPAKGGKKDGNAKKELLREVVIQSKRVHVLAKQLVTQAKQNEEAFALITKPARDIIRAPAPTERFTADQMSEMLGLFLLFTTLIERYARRLRSG